MKLTIRANFRQAGADCGVYYDPSDVYHQRSRAGLFLNPALDIRERDRRTGLPTSD
jgi:hypothetical protein